MGAMLIIPVHVIYCRTGSAGGNKYNFAVLHRHCGPCVGCIGFVHAVIIIMFF